MRTLQIAIQLSLLVCTDAFSSRACGALPILPPADIGLNAEQLDKIDGLVAKEIEAKKLPGCVVAIGRTGGVGFLKAYGQRQIKPEVEAMTVDTVFDMASVTKPTATATSIMILVERGLVRPYWEDDGP